MKYLEELIIFVPVFLKKKKQICFKGTVKVRKITNTLLLAVSVLPGKYANIFHAQKLALGNDTSSIFLLLPSQSNPVVKHTYS